VVISLEIKCSPELKGSSDFQTQHRNSIKYEISKLNNSSCGPTRNW